ncbi:hypothetical protein ACA910_004566 [Epithemia clementina (nom. ined.)]
MDRRTATRSSRKNKQGQEQDRGRVRRHRHRIGTSSSLTNSSYHPPSSFDLWCGTAIPGRYIILWFMGTLAAFTLLANVYFFHVKKDNRVHGTVQHAPALPAKLLENSEPNLDWKDEAINNSSKARVLKILEEARTSVSPSMLEQLPTWEEVIQQYGEHPVILYGSEEGGRTSCDVFQDRVPPTRRMLGAAGMFSTGTNLVTTLLKKNCHIPERVALYGVNSSREQHGIRWQVPWGKHTQQQYRDNHAAEHAKAIVKDDILPIITIRHPISWMQSMCKNPYTARWVYGRKGQCPHLLLEPQQAAHRSDIQADVAVDDARNDDPNKGDRKDNWNLVTVKYGAGTETYKSLAHLFNDWYHGYTKHANYPWVMIRMEDLIFHTKETIERVCHCAGGRLIEHANHRAFEYTVDSAKADSPGHDTSTGLVEAWIKYSKSPWPQAMETWSPDDFLAAKEILDPKLMEFFRYSNLD